MVAPAEQLNAVNLEPSGIKDRICEQTLLHHADFSRPFVLFTDASETGGASGLFQFREDTPQDVINAATPDFNYLVPLGFHSRKFNKVQQRYSVLEKELTALLDATSKFSYFLSSQSGTIIYTDAKTILFLLSHHFTSDNVKLMRHSIKLMSIPNVTIRHISGAKNILADALSRQWDKPKEQPIRIKAKHATKEDIHREFREGEETTLDQMIEELDNNPKLVGSLSSMPINGTTCR